VSPFFLLTETQPEIFQPHSISIRTTDLSVYNYSPQFCSLHEQSTTYVSLLHHASPQFSPHPIVPWSPVWRIAQTACWVPWLGYGTDIRRSVVRVTRSSVHPDRLRAATQSPAKRVLDALSPDDKEAET